MSKFATTLQNLPNIVKYGLVIGAIIFISTLFPNQNRFPYSIEKGNKWSYEDLYAPIDFEVPKSEEEIADEQLQIEKKYAAIYNFNSKIKKDRRNAFKGAFDQKLELSKSTFVDVATNTDQYYQEGYQTIDLIYDHGVIEFAPKHQNLPNDFPINVLKGFVPEKQEIGYFYTPKVASEKAIETVFKKRLPEGDFLMSLFDESFFYANVIFQDSVTQRYQQDQFDKINPIKDSIEVNQLLIANGEEITEEKSQVLSALKRYYGPGGSLGKFSWSAFFGYLLLTSLVIGILLFYLQYDAVEIFNRYSWLIFILFWVVLYSFLVYSVEASNTLNAFMIPFCIAPIILKSFFDERVALFTHIITILIASFLSSEGYEFTFLQLLAGIVAVLTPIETRDWTKFFYFLATIFGTYVLGFLGLSLISKTGLVAMEWSTYGWIFWSVFLTLLAYPLIPLFERIFGFTSPISLMELSDINKPLLKKLAEEAPGTFQHSLQVGNLSEAAANQIDADGLLVKVAALYHDIGKVNQPEYFIENQNGKNPHDDLDPLESAKIIIGHVTEGEKMAKKNRLPSKVIDFIKTHHGTTRVEYFFRKYKELNPTQKIPEKDFTYPGPLPKSKEQTILMLADSIEAAAKTLKVKNEETLQDLVNDIVAYKIDMGQLAKSELTFEELEICKEAFGKTLRSVYHLRIEY